MTKNKSGAAIIKATEANKLRWKRKRSCGRGRWVSGSIGWFGWLGWKLVKLSKNKLYQTSPWKSASGIKWKWKWADLACRWGCSKGLLEWVARGDIKKGARRGHYRESSGVNNDVIVVQAKSRTGRTSIRRMEGGYFLAYKRISS